MGEAATLRVDALQESGFRWEDGAGLFAAFVLHAGVVAVLLLQPSPPEFVDTAETMTVSLATEVSLENTGPAIVPESRAATAPELSEEPAPVEEGEDSAPALAETSTSIPEPAPSTSQRASRRSDPTPNRTRNRPDRKEPKATSTPKEKKGGGSKFDDAFKEGAGSSATAKEPRPPASQISAAAKRSLKSEMDRQIKPHWRGKVPQGLDSEKLISLVTFRLRENGSLQGVPKCRTKPSSITPSNRPQAATHCERAVRAIQLAAPFQLPDEFYNSWKSIKNWEMKKQ